MYHQALDQLSVLMRTCGRDDADTEVKARSLISEALSFCETGVYVEDCCRELIGLIANFVAALDETSLFDAPGLMRQRSHIIDGVEALRDEIRLELGEVSAAEEPISVAVSADYFVH